MSKKVHALDTISGKVGIVPEIYLELPGFKDHLVLVDEDAKDHEPALYKPATAEEYTTRKSGRKINEKLERVEEDSLEDTQPTLDSDLQ